MASEDDRRATATTFLDRRLYRRRRLIDAIKLMPALAAIVFILPALILGGRGAAPAQTATYLIYFFGCWAFLIAAMAALRRALPSEEDAPPSEPGG